VSGILDAVLSLTVAEFAVVVIVAVVAGAGIEGVFTFRRIHRLERALDERAAQVVELRVKSKGVDHGD
jgi:hypothetical protein